MARVREKSALMECLRYTDPATYLLHQVTRARPASLVISGQVVGRFGGVRDWGAGPWRVHNEGLLLPYFLRTAQGRNKCLEEEQVEIGRLISVSRCGQTSTSQLVGVVQTWRSVQKAVSGWISACAVSHSGLEIRQLSRAVC